MLKLLKSPCGESPPPPHFGPRRFVAGSIVTGRSERKRAIWKNVGANIFISFFILISAFPYICVRLSQRRVVTISDEFWSQKGHKIKEKRCLGKPKWSPNRWKIRPKWVQMATWSNIGDGEGKKTVRGLCGGPAGLHFERQMGAKLEPKVVKTANKNALKFVVDFKSHFWRKSRQNGANMGAKMESKWSQSRSKRRRKRTKTENVKIVLTL